MRTVRLTEETKKNILEDLLKRSPNQYKEYTEKVEAILKDVQENGDKAVFGYTEKFDKAVLTADTVRVTEEEIAEAYEKLPKISFDYEVLEKAKKLILRTDVVRQYPPYPTFEGERFVPLGSLYTMIDRDYKLSVLDAVVCLVEYMPDGSTHNMTRQYYRNPNGFRYGRLVTLSENTTLKRRLVLYVHYAAESILAGKPIVKDAPNKLLGLMSIPFGAALAVYINSRCRKS